MKELSLYILDIAQNSVSAGAEHILIELTDDGQGRLVVTIKDDGRGMTADVLRMATDPFYTTRTTRRVGLGLPLFKLAAEQTGGSITVESTAVEDDSVHHGTTVKAVFNTLSMNHLPLGDMVSTVCTLIHANPQIDYTFIHTTPDKVVRLDTAQVKSILGKDISLSEPEVLCWLTDYLAGQYESNNNLEVIE